jgi:spore coat protein U-like protein
LSTNHLYSFGGGGRLSHHVSTRLLVCAAVLAAATGARADCTVSVGALAFGSYDVFAGAPTDSTATITYSCSGPATTPTLSIGTGVAGSFSPRRIKSGVNALSYNLYVDAARTSVWGDGTGGTSTVAASMGTGLTSTVYGRVFAGQTGAPAGSYLDTVVVTINF